MPTLSLIDIELEIKKRHLENWYILDVLSNYKDSFIIYGAASVAITDREGHKITIPALKKAVAKFMENPKYRDLNIFHCLKGNTLIDTEWGLIPIEDVVVGDNVFTHKERYKPVVKTFKHLINGDILKITFSHGDIIEITDEHPVLMISGEWKKTKDLKVGDVLQIQGLWSFKAVIKNIEKIKYSGFVYNIEVADDNSYCGKYIIFHNSDVQVGEILPYWIHPTTGKVYRTEVNDSGWWVCCKIRGDLEIAKKVREEVEKGNLRAFSIAGTATNKSHDYDPFNPHENINDLEIYECVVPETRIQTLNGEKEIKDIVLGDYVLTHNMRFKPVDKLIKHYIDGAICEIPFTNGSTLHITPNHQVLTKQADKDVWERADDLTYKTPVYGYVGIWDGQKMTNATKIIVKNYKGFVYNLEVKDDHSYIADNIVVANCTICVEGVNALAKFSVIYH